MTGINVAISQYKRTKYLIIVIQRIKLIVQSYCQFMKNLEQITKENISSLLSLYTHAKRKYKKDATKIIRGNAMNLITKNY